MTLPLPAVFAAWGTAAGGQWERSLGSLIDRATTAGLKSLALNVADTTREQVAEVQQVGLKVIGWGTFGAGWRARVDELKLDAFMPQVESADQRAGAIAAIKEGCGAGLPLAVVTTYGGLDDTTGAAWRELEAVGVATCLVECYAADDPIIHADIGRMLGQGAVYGIPRAALRAVAGVYRGELPSAYKDAPLTAALYLAEAMSSVQWLEWGKLLKTPPPPMPRPTGRAWWDLNAGAVRLHTERAMTYPNGSTGLELMLAWMTRNDAKIRAAKAVTLSRVVR